MRLTNAFSKKLDNRAYAVDLHMMYHNFVRILKTTRVTPAIPAGVSTKLWKSDDIAKLGEDAEAPVEEQGPCQTSLQKREAKCDTGPLMR